MIEEIQIETLGWQLNVCSTNILKVSNSIRAKIAVVPDWR